MRRVRRTILALFGLAAASLSMAVGSARGADIAKPAPDKQELDIMVSDVLSSHGHVRVEVCSEQEFLKDCLYGGSELSTIGVTTVVIRDLPPGVYAVQAYQDENDNHDVDRNRLGVPKEGIGFSNDAPIYFAPPSFKSAAFSYRGGHHTIHLRLRHFLR
jgi:uncharacterized protein (DUF2141 family)